MNASDTASLPPLDQLHPIIRDLHAYWLKIHPATGLPGRQHFDPLDVPKLLGHIWLVDVDHAPLRFRYRLVGSKLVEAGSPARAGARVEDCVTDEEDRKRVTGLFARTVTTRTPSWRKGPPTIHHSRYISSLEVVILPLARDGVTVDNLLNATVFYWTPERAGRQRGAG